MAAAGRSVWLDLNHYPKHAMLLRFDVDGHDRVVVINAREHEDATAALAEAATRSAPEFPGSR